jgi:Zn-finger nucleic acid-binding protein
MRLVACKQCRAQYDVTDYAWERFQCRCGHPVEAAAPQEAVTVVVHNCSACGAPMDPDEDACRYCRAKVERDQRKLSLLCPECLARNTQGSAFCRGCGIEFKAERVEEAPADLLCPACGTGMTRRAVAGHPADECPKCNGLWIAREYFTALVNRAVKAFREQGGYAERGGRRGASTPALSTQVVYRRCPSCQQVMHRKNFERVSGVIIDDCVDHGIWLDADELEQIAGFLLGGGLERTTAFEQRHAVRDSRPASSGARAPAGKVAWTHRGGGRRNNGLVDVLGETLVDVLESLFRRL